MPSSEIYRSALCALPSSDWEPYLLAHANLPGPRGNLELAQAVADMGTEVQFRRWAVLGPDVAPENTPECFLAVCGVVGLGAILARRGGFASINAPTTVDEEPAMHGRSAAAQENPPLPILRALASDPRWRIREAVAMALQRWGDADMAALLAEMAVWATGNPWEQRAAAAALCEPRLLKKPEHAAAVLSILDQITATIKQVTDRKSDAFKTLRQGLAYCWSVAVAALPDTGKPLMEKWLASPDPDIRWIMAENLKKNRLAKTDAAWVAACLAQS
ncbi:MAG: HEAT repeat domain-containing protein [Chloroflexi bacterium]|nr:HEAT repeat domain-containing protein [Chloroflexota bacterium]